MRHENAEAGASSVKTIGQSGQVSLGKEYAGRHVSVREVEPGVWLIKLGQFVPDNERWLHAPSVKDDLDRAIAWAATHPARQTDLNGLERTLKRRKRAKT